MRGLAQRSRAEIARLARFALVGLAVAALYGVLYFVLRGMGLVPWLASIAAFAGAVTMQYVAHTVFTFRAPVDEPGQLARFVVTVTVGALLSTVITGFVGPSLGWPESVSILAVVVILPVTNFVIFRFWVFRAIDARLRAEEDLNSR